MPKALVIVAHPDDETIWCGGTILAHPEWEWTILSLCRKNDKDRAPKFKSACEILNAKCSISDLDDEEPEKKLRSLNEVKSRILSMLKDKKFDFVFTHGSNGEYGHNRHREVHAAVRDLLAEKQLECKKIFFFSYKLDKSKQSCVADTRSADVNSVLSEEIAREKRLLITSTYGFNSGGFEERSARATESFKVVESK